MTKDSLLKMEMGKKSKVALTIPLVDIMKLSLSPDAGNQVVIIQLRGMLYHKTLVQTVIILFGSKVMPQIRKTKKKRKCKKHEKHYTNECFFTKSQKSRNRNICVLCHNFWPNYNLDLLSTSKWPSEPQFCERYVCRWQKFG